MSDPQDQDPKIKVVDRRRFTESGELRPDRESVPASPPQRPAAPPRPEPRPQQPAVEKPRAAEPSSGAAGRQRATTPLFMELVSSLAQQAALFIEGGEGFPAQPDHARRIIDYLAVLEEKTRGNLSSEEEQALSGIVNELRTIYVKRST